MVDNPFEITYDELLALDAVEEVVTLQCVSNEVGGDLVGNAVWQGVPLSVLLDRAGVQPGATQIVGRSVDRFTAGFPTELVGDGRVAMLAYAMNGEPLPARHGFPARLVVSGLYGYVSATKWLGEIELTTWEDFDGFWIPRGWSKEGPIKTASRIDVPRARDRTSGRHRRRRRGRPRPEPGDRQGRAAGRRRPVAGVPPRRGRQRAHLGPVVFPVGGDTGGARVACPGDRCERRDTDRGPELAGARRGDGLAQPERHRRLTRRHTAAAAGLLHAPERWFGRSCRASPRLAGRSARVTTDTSSRVLHRGTVL